GPRALARLTPGNGVPAAGTLRGSLALGALNGAVGDRLAESGNPLALDMTLRGGGYSPQIAVFVHGLCETDDAWALFGDRPYGARLEEDLGYTPLYLRYNTGLHISDNGRRLLLRGRDDRAEHGLARGRPARALPERVRQGTAAADPVRGRQRDAPGGRPPPPAPESPGRLRPDRQLAGGARIRRTWLSDTSAASATRCTRWSSSGVVGRSRRISSSGLGIGGTSVAGSGFSRPHWYSMRPHTSGSTCSTRTPQPILRRQSATPAPQLMQR